MKWALRQLAAPVRYLGISQGSGWLTSKLTYDWVIPLTFSTMATLAVSYFRFSLGLFSDTGFISGVINLLNLLIAFFIAALAAVATFDRKGLDDAMKGEPAIMRRRDSKGIVRDRILTHRQFICYLFGYLSFCSIMLLLALYAIRLAGKRAVAAVDWELAVGNLMLMSSDILKIFGSFIFFLTFSQIVIAMLLGIYFLADRLQFLDDPND